MTGRTVYAQGWTLDDVQWSNFDASKVQPWMLAAIKGSALVEYNAPDYVTYLKRVFKDAGAETHAAIEQWGREETQHGRAPTSPPCRRNVPAHSPHESARRLLQDGT